MKRQLLSLLILSLAFFFPIPVSAAETCSSLGITYSPTAFEPSASAPVIRITITNDNTFNYLRDRGGYVRLHFILPISGPLGDYNTKPIQVTEKSFDITLETESRPIGIGQDWMQTTGSHQAVLDLGNNPKGGTSGFNEFCKDIKYTIGDPNACHIDDNLGTPEGAIAPKGNFPVAFVGAPSTKYYLTISTPKLTARINQSEATTDATGQGRFPVKLDSESGDTIYLRVSTNPAGSTICAKTLKLSTTAPLPDLDPRPVVKLPPGITIGPGGTIKGPTGKALCQMGEPNCVTAGGKPVQKCTDDEKNPGIATAIGCIHTNPISFIKDTFGFVIGIAGGLAFLMMLLGAFQMLSSAGNPETLHAGRERFTSAIIGLLFVIFAVLLLQIIGADILRIPGFDR